MSSLLVLSEGLNGRETIVKPKKFVSFLTLGYQVQLQKNCPLALKDALHNGLILLINWGCFLTFLIFLNKLALLLFLVGSAILGEVPLGEPLDGSEGLTLQLEKREDCEEGPED